MKTGVAGSVASHDCLITVRPHDRLEIIIESIVHAQFGKQIEHVINETLRELGIRKLYVHINDRGALDYAIKARLITAIKRLEETNA
ncbi:MAG: citrate lyase acyl carrier protein [Acholeplasmataceae bacterium]|nr:MAG: citrate lyase acyl carrier protein [Acholeplasmataceae bacterium]